MKAGRKGKRLSVSGQVEALATRDKKGKKKEYKAVSNRKKELIM
jgi:hypothetical protein